MTYVFLNKDNSVVGRIDEDGKMRMSGSATAWSEYLSWVEGGGATDPYVPPTVIDGIDDLGRAKVVASDSVRTTAYDLLQPTDWVVVREMESGVAAPAEITAYRTAVRAAAADKISAIESKGKLSTLATYLRSDEFAAWPDAPSA